MHSAVFMHLPLSDIFFVQASPYLLKISSPTEFLFILSFPKTWGCKSLFCKECGAEPPGKWSFFCLQSKFGVLEHITSSSSGHHQARHGSAPKGDEAAH